jgi:hypothetical protein
MMIQIDEHIFGMVCSTISRSHKNYIYICTYIITYKWIYMGCHEDPGSLHQEIETLRS